MLGEENCFEDTISSILYWNFAKNRQDEGQEELYTLKKGFGWVSSWKYGEKEGFCRSHCTLSCC